jgi:4-amino-4-deoxy-L-arabinose transferase-like glycosyltransferase
MTNGVTNEERSSGVSRQTLVVLGLALLLRIFGAWYAFAHFPHGWFFQRGTEMGLMGQAIVTGHGLASPFGGDTGPTAMFAPIYPLLVAAVFRFFGVATNASAIALVAVNLVAELTAIWLMMRVARRYFDERAALIAGLIWTLSPTLWFLPTIFWDTSITLCLLMGLIALSLQVQARPTVATWAGFGAFCGLVALFNPALVLTLAGVVGVSAFVLARAHTLAWKPFALAAAVFALVFCVWPIRNARVFHAFVPLRTAVGLDVWMGNHDGATGYLDEKLFPTFNAAELAAYTSEGEIAYTQGKMKAAEAWIATHPAQFATLTARRFARFWLGSGTRGGPALFWLHATFTTVLGAFGWWFLWRRNRELAMLFAVPLLLFPLPYYVAHAEFRFRVVLDPLLSVLAAYALVRWVHGSQTRKPTS